MVRRRRIRTKLQTPVQTMTETTSYRYVPECRQPRVANRFVPWARERHRSRINLHRLLPRLPRCRSRSSLRQLARPALRQPRPRRLSIRMMRAILQQSRSRRRSRSLSNCRSCSRGTARRRTRHSSHSRQEYWHQASEEPAFSSGQYRRGARLGAHEPDASAPGRSGTLPGRASTPAKHPLQAKRRPHRSAK